MFKLTIETNNAVFKDPATGKENTIYEGIEIRRILREIGDKATAGVRSGVIADANGNNVGEWHFE